MTTIHRFVAGVALVLFGCGTFGSADDPKGDASAPVPDDGGTLSDGAVPPAEAGGSGGDGGTGFCSSRSGFAFCEDFDNRAVAGEGWTLETVNGGGAKQLDPFISTSAPKSMRLQIPASEKNGAFAFLSQRVERSSWPRSRFEFSLYLRPQNWSGAMNAAIASVRYADATDAPAFDAYLVIAEGYTGIAVAVDDTYLDTPKGAVLPSNEWLRMALEVDPMTSVEAPVRLYANGTKLIDARVPVQGTTRKPSRFYVSIGPWSINATPALDINYDDVLFETR